jgi:peptidoglycan/xylan/chitin deacetylase (PgdA/CDA1 family)
LLALRVDVDTGVGMREGVPRLRELLERQHARATFFATLGRDRGSAAVAAALGALAPAARRQWLAPARELERWPERLPLPRAMPGHAAAALRALRDAGHELGLRADDPLRWMARIADADRGWTHTAMQRACERFERLIGEAPRGQAAPGWRGNRHTLRLTQALGFGWSSDVRGVHPFVPVYNAELIGCPQLPTTLPTLDEACAVEGCDPDVAAHRLLGMTARIRGGASEVFALRAEVEGLALAGVFQQLLAGWRDQGFELVALRTLAETCRLESLPRHEVLLGDVPGRPHPCWIQGPEFPDPDFVAPAAAGHPLASPAPDAGAAAASITRDQRD